MYISVCMRVYLYFCISYLYFFVKLFFLHSVGVPLQTDCVFMRTLFTIPARLDLSYFCILCIFKPSAFTAECIQWHRSQGKLETLEQREYICYFILPAVKGHRTGVSDRKFEITTCPSGNTSATLFYQLLQDMTWSSKSSQKAGSKFNFHRCSICIYSPRLDIQCLTFESRAVNLWPLLSLDIHHCPLLCNTDLDIHHFESRLALLGLT